MSVSGRLAHTVPTVEGYFFYETTETYHNLSAFFLLSPKHIPKHFSSFGGSSTRQAR